MPIRDHRKSFYCSKYIHVLNHPLSFLLREKKDLFDSGFWWIKNTLTSPRNRRQQKMIQLYGLFESQAYIEYMNQSYCTICSVRCIIMLHKKLLTIHIYKIRIVISPEKTLKVVTRLISRIIKFFLAWPCDDYQYMQMFLGNKIMCQENNK